MMFNIKERFDCVVILSIEDWPSDRRGDQYNYAISFSNLLPVFYIQSNKSESVDLILKYDLNIAIVNPVHGKTTNTFRALISFLNKNGFKSILFWSYSPFYGKILKNIAYPHSLVYHATNKILDTTEHNSLNTYHNIYIESLRDSINYSDFILASSKEIYDSLQKEKDLFKPIFISTEGYDFNFWNGVQSDISKRELAIIYNGKIDDRLDLNLISYIIQNNPDLQFWFSGVVVFLKKENLANWIKILRIKNVTYHGKLSLEDEKVLINKAKIGILPFNTSEDISGVLSPSSAYEYLSGGLEVISTSLQSIQKNKNIHIANNRDDFNELISRLIWINIEFNETQIDECRKEDYNEKFKSVIKIIENECFPRFNPSLKLMKKRILLLYDINSCHVNTLREHVNSFGIFSRHSITFYNCTNESDINECHLNSFDVVVVHYSVRLSYSNHISELILNKLTNFLGTKILFIQDEYDNLKSTYSYIKRIDFNILFTCVPQEFHDYVYPKSIFPNLKLINNLTGYVSYALNNFKTPLIKDRLVHVFYRGRKLPYFYGTLGMEKYYIGVNFKEKCNENAKHLKIDIESDDEFRIYGNAWYQNLASSRAMLATESGSNLFDFNGDLKTRIQNELDSGNNYNDIYNLFIAESEKNIKMNQISPKLFEAISLKTVLILFEGNYSGILIPNRHYLPLKKDFSNFDEIVKDLDNVEKLQKIADCAYNEIILNFNYSYQNFINSNFDKVVDEETLTVNHYESVIGSNDKDSVFYNYFKAINQQLYKLGFSNHTILSDEYEYYLDQGKYYNSLSNKVLSLNLGSYNLISSIDEVYKNPNNNELYDTYLENDYNSIIASKKYPYTVFAQTILFDNRDEVTEKKSINLYFTLSSIFLFLKNNYGQFWRLFKRLLYLILTNIKYNFNSIINKQSNKFKV